MKFKMVLIAVVTSLMIYASANATDKTEKPTDKPGQIEVIEVTFEGSVETIDRENRQVTLKGVDGTIVSIDVEDDAQDLSQVDVGDIVLVKYIESVAFQVFAPGELTPGASIIGAEVKTTPGEKPGKVAVEETIVVVTIEAIDKENEMATLKGPDGNLDTVKVRNPENLEKVSVGDKVMIVHTRAIGVSVVEKPAE